MNCEEFNNALVDDHRDETQLAEHARECAACAAALADDRALARAVESWRATTPAPAADLEARILGALGTESVASLDRGSSLWRWAAAAVLLIGSAVALSQLLMPSDPLADLVRQVEQAEREHTEAIAALEREGQKRLASAGDPAVSAEQAALLLTYRDRLSHLDSVIDEVQLFLAESPGHAGGHTVLLAAYKEKADVLQELLELPLGESS